MWGALFAPAVKPGPCVNMFMFMGRLGEEGEGEQCPVLCRFSNEGLGMSARFLQMGAFEMVLRRRSAVIGAKCAL